MQMQAEVPEYHVTSSLLLLKLNHISSSTWPKGPISKLKRFFIRKFAIRGQALSYGIRTYGPNSLDNAHGKCWQKGQSLNSLPF